MARTVAALYVDTGGCYFGLPDVDPWDEARDARNYAGPYPVVAHPPCERWGNYWFGGPAWVAAGNAPKRLGDDGGCFRAALDAVRRHGGVLEHPAGSRAWEWFEIDRPMRGYGWSPADFCGGWTCLVDQGCYGHRAAKPSMLYAVAPSLPSLDWSRAVVEPVSEKAAARNEGNCMYLSRKQRAATPAPFRDILLSIARSCHA